MSVGWLLEFLVVRCSVGGVKCLVVVPLRRGGVSGCPRGVITFGLITFSYILRFSYILDILDSNLPTQCHGKSWKIENAPKYHKYSEYSILLFGNISIVL